MVFGTSMILELIINIMPLFSYKSNLHQKDGKITADFSSIKNQFDQVIIKMDGFAEFGDTLSTLDTVNAIEGKFEYHFKVPEKRLAIFTLLKNKEIVSEIAMKDNNTSENCGYFSEILIGNEDVKMNSRDSDWPGLPFVVAYCDGLKENKWYYMFSPAYGPQYDQVSKVFVNENPASYAILQSIYSQKELFTSQEIAEMLDLFSDELKQSNTFMVIKEYLKTQLEMENANK